MINPLYPSSTTGVRATDPILQVAHLTVGYAGNPALQDISFTVQRGDSVAVIGPNGAGKSTLMKSIMGFLPAGDAVRVNCQHLPGYVPQQQDVDWNFPITVSEVVLLGLTRQIGWLRRANRQHYQRVQAALQRVGLTEYATRQIGELSGGQRQRVFIARALAQEVDLLLLDEPFAGVDVSAQAELMDIISGLNTDGLTILLSTHDLGLAFRRFNKVLALNKSLIAYGAPNDLHTSEVLRGLYGGGFTEVQETQQVTLFVDEHGCC